MHCREATASKSNAVVAWQDYKKANLGTKYKCNPFGGTSAHSIRGSNDSYRSRLCTLLFS